MTDEKKLWHIRPTKVCRIGIIYAQGERRIRKSREKEISKNTKKSPSYYPLMTAWYSSRRLLMQSAKQDVTGRGGDAASLNRIAAVRQIAEPKYPAFMGTNIARWRAAAITK